MRLDVVIELVDQHLFLLIGQAVDVNRVVFQLTLYFLIEPAFPFQTALYAFKAFVYLVLDRYGHFKNQQFTLINLSLANGAVNLLLEGLGPDKEQHLIPRML